MKSTSPPPPPNLNSLRAKPAHSLSRPLTTLSTTETSATFPHRIHERRSYRTSTSSRSVASKSHYSDIGWDDAEDLDRRRISAKVGWEAVERLLGVRWHEQSRWRVENNNHLPLAETGAQKNTKDISHHIEDFSSPSCTVSFVFYFDTRRFPL